MFRKGDEAFIRATGEHITVQGPLSFAEEKRLHRAHPTVLNSIKAGPDAEARYFAEEYQRPRKKEKSGEETLLRIKLTSYFRTWEKEFSFNGHYYGAKPRIRDLLVLYPLLDEVSFADITRLLEAIEQDKALPEWVYLGTAEVMYDQGCPHCGQKEFTLESNGESLRFGSTPCPYSEGFSQIVFELNVPSGKLVFGDVRDLEELFLFPLPHGERDYPSQQRFVTLQAEVKGLASFYFGQAYPVFYRLNEKSFKITNQVWDERWDAKKKKYVHVKVPKIKGEEITHTEFGFSACDGEVYDKFLKHISPKDVPEVTIFDVPPGVYEFRVFVNNLHTEERGKEIRFAEIKYLREPGPVRDYLAEYLALTPTPEQIVRSEVIQWPTLYGVREKTWETMTEVERYHSWRKVADQLFFVIGGGTDWHKKGFPLISVAGIPPDPTNVIPKFREQLHWYPFYENYSILSKKTNLTPEFACYAFEALESVISFGAEPYDDPGSGRDVQRCRGMMSLALKWYRKLAKKHSKSADPDFLAWVSEKKRAETWIKMFDLGPEFTAKHDAHFLAQKWLPEDVQYLEFDARKLKDGHFAWKKGYWAKKEDAECYAIPAAEDSSSAWFSTANKYIPLYAVAKVTKLGVRDHCGKRIVTVAFEYGSDWMQDPSVRKGFFERDEKAALRPLTKEEYDQCLSKAKEVAAEFQRLKSKL